MTGFRVTERLIARRLNRSWPVSSHLPYIFVGEFSVQLLYVVAWKASVTLPRSFMLKFANF